MTATDPTIFTRQRPPVHPDQRRETREAIANEHHRNALQRSDALRIHQGIVREWTRFILGRMFKDRTGSYHPFVLNNLIEQDAVTESDKTCQRRRVLTNVCETATLALNPAVSKSHPTRHRPTDSCGLIVLPATTVGGVHLHGFIRTPRAYQHAVQAVAAGLMIAFQTKNLWISDVTELRQDGASLNYLSKTWKQEHRDWYALDFVPAHVFTRLTGEPH